MTNKAFLLFVALFAFSDSDGSSDRPRCARVWADIAKVVRQVRDASGAIIEVTLDKAGKVVGTRVISQGTGTRQ